MKHHMSKWLALLTALILALGTGLSAAETQSAEEPVLFGSPWINSNVGGNLPAEAPSPRDDLYLSVNYDSPSGGYDLYSDGHVRAAPARCYGADS